MDNITIKELEGNKLYMEMLFYNTFQWYLFPYVSNYAISEYFETYWWSFLQWLAVALSRADDNNTRKIRENWCEEISEHIDVIVDMEKKLWLKN